MQLVEIHTVNLDVELIIFILQIIMTIEKQITIPYGFNTSIHTLIQHDTMAEKDVNVPEYLQIDTPNPMTDDVSKSIIIPYGLNVGLNDTKVSIYNANENKNITISKGRIIPTTFNIGWNIFFLMLLRPYYSLINTYIATINFIIIFIFMQIVRIWDVFFL
jgi:hypothetical protein